MPREVQNAVECSGSIAGLGSADRVTITVDASLACETKSGANQPRGHLQGTSQPIDVRSGRVSFDVTTSQADCPPGLVPVVGDTATIIVRAFFSGEVLSEPRFQSSSRKAQGIDKRDRPERSLSVLLAG